VKKLIVLAIMWLILMSSIHQTTLADEMNNKIEISITNIDKSRGGNLIVFIYKDNNFPSGEEKAIVKRTFKVQHTTQVVKFSDNNYPDELAFKILHDEDANEKTTKNWTGIWPSEGLGYSNNQTLGVLGAPSFDDAKITKENYLAGVTIKLDY